MALGAPNQQLVLLLLGLIPGALWYLGIIREAQAGLAIMLLTLMSKRAMGQAEKAQKEKQAREEEEEERAAEARVASRAGLKGKGKKKR